jgi:hypothetical protein
MINLDHMRNAASFFYYLILVNFVNAEADEFPLPGYTKKKK